MGYLLSPPTRLFFFLDFRKFCFTCNIDAFWKFWFARSYLCPPMGYLLSPPTRQFLEFFGSFVLRVIFCALCFSDYGNLQRFFVLRVIICALQFFGVSCVLHAALAACVCCSILSISRMMCGVRNSLCMFW